MTMQPFNTLTSKVTPILENDINTDQIIPSQFLRDINADLGYGLFAFLRRTPQGEIKSDFPLENPRYRGSQILLVGENFGCGSSREHAVWAMQDYGFRCLIGLSFAELFRENCLKNGLLPITLTPDLMSRVMQMVDKGTNPQTITVDLNALTISNVDGIKIIDFSINENERNMLLNGLDDIALTLQEMKSIQNWEQTTSENKAWLIKPINLIS